MKLSAKWRKISRLLVIAFLVLLVLTGIVSGVLFMIINAAVGKLPDEATYRSYEKLSNFKDGKFENFQPMRHIVFKKPRMQVITRFIFDKPKGPPKPIPVIPIDHTALGAKSTGLKVHWLGHSNLIFDIDGTRIMTDPVLDNAGPLPFIVRRFQPSPLQREEIPKLGLDAIIISHDHYDHLEKKTIEFLRNSDIKFITPLGVGARLRGWGIPAERITEMNWGDSIQVGSLKITAQTTRHFSGRLFSDRNRTLWAAFILEGPQHKVFFAGDGGYGEHFKKIGQEHGPFDLTCLEIGSWNERWPNSHLFPEETVQAHLDLRGKYLLPMHWSVFDLAFHEWDEPIRRVTAAAAKEGVAILTPQQGQPLIPGETTFTEWWK